MKFKDYMLNTKVEYYTLKNIKTGKEVDQEVVVTKYGDYFFPKFDWADLLTDSTTGNYYELSTEIAPCPIISDWNYAEVEAFYQYCVELEKLTGNVELKFVSCMPKIFISEHVYYEKYNKDYTLTDLEDILENLEYELKQLEKDPQPLSNTQAEALKILKGEN